MAGKNPLIAKITRPVLTGVFSRRRLFKQINNCRDKPVIWVSGPPGCGKTTLIASYLDACKLPCLWYKVDEGDTDIASLFYYMDLAVKRAAIQREKPLPLFTSEYLNRIPVFAKKFFENLYSSLKAPFMIVFDNYQQVSIKSKFHEVIREGLRIIPEKIHVIVISREDPPIQFIRLQANDKFHFLGWKDIRFTLNEFREIVRMKGWKHKENETLLELYRKTEGWVAGLVLIMEMAKRKNNGYQLLTKRIPEEIFNYFTSEILYKTDKKTQDFLLKTSFLPRVTCLMAEKLTGNLQSQRILSNLHKKNYFIMKYAYKPEVYQYHPLFREFLLDRAKHAFVPEHLSQIQHTTATLLEANGQIEDALEIFCAAEEWTSMIPLILKQAPAMIDQGRWQTLEGLIKKLPKPIVEQNPWLLYWIGTCCFVSSSSHGLKYFEMSFGLFRKKSDSVGIFLSWAGIVDCLVYEFNMFKPLDYWISTLSELLKEHKSFPSREVETRVTASMLSAIVMRQPQHPFFETWAERAQVFSQSSPDVHIKIQVLRSLGIHVLFSGEFTKAVLLINSFQQIIQTPDIRPLALILLKDIEAFYYWLTAQFEENRKAVKEGIELAAASGVHLWDTYLLEHCVAGALSEGDMAKARALLKKIGSRLEGMRLWEKSFYHFLVMWEALLQENLKKALLHGELSLQYSLNTGMPHTEAICHLGKAHVMHEFGEHEKALEHLALARGIGKEIKNKIVEFMCFLAEAYFSFNQGRNELGMDLLQKTMALGRENNYLNTYLWRPSVMTGLCLKALEAGIETDYVQNLICKRNLSPDKPPLEIAQWPWPLKIFTFGRFGLIKQGKPVQFSGKVQQKPFAMLKALITFGGRGVTKLQLMDILWPETEGDAAHSAFTTTLSRLRHILGTEKAIKFQDGKATLDVCHCWVDAWAFERILGQVDAVWEEDLTGDGLIQAIHLAEKATKMYTGSFLAGETDPWTISFRERLRNKFLRNIVRLGYHWEKVGELNKAVNYYQRGLEVDDLAEEFYQRLMGCYQRMGRCAEAMAVYNRCQKVLSSVLGIQPSPKTKALYESLCKS